MRSKILITFLEIILSLVYFGTSISLCAGKYSLATPHHCADNTSLYCATLSMDRANQSITHDIATSINQHTDTCTQMRVCVFMPCTGAPSLLLLVKT